MSQAIPQLFANLWQDYVSITPSAKRIHALLESDSGTASDIVNDHIALRTFNLPKVGLDKLAAHFLSLGYKQGGEYHFKEKKLYAQHFEHPDPTVAKVFISELLVEQLSEQAQKVIACMVDAIDEAKVADSSFLYSGAHWPLSQSDYQLLVQESEYAAWMSVWGFRANHFTVSVNQLPHVDELVEVNSLLKAAGFELNQAGGEIKGHADVYLAQSATIADRVAVNFKEGEMIIPSCFYEFAQRYPIADGQLYSGFVAASADKIFESTNAVAENKKAS
jgi:hypothetical protein